MTVKAISLYYSLPALEIGLTQLLENYLISFKTFKTKPIITFFIAYCETVLYLLATCILG